MFSENLPNKARTISTVLFVLDCIAAFILGISIWDDWHNQWVYSILILIFVPLTSYFSCLLICMFADIAESTADIQQKLTDGKKVLTDIRQNLNGEKAPEPKNTAPFTKEVPAGAPSWEKFM